MIFNYSLRVLVGLSLMFSSAYSWSLNVEEFQQYCDKSKLDSAFCQSYLGGAMDAIAVMNDEAKRTGNEIYCVHEKEIFNAPEMMDYILAQPSRFHKKNAILPLLDYLKAKGGCGDI
ncbi:hypothetical protein PN836_004545 [Ningiella sp. W23]|uniref:hypothetical protein n=1 Tax=Ningiella sp. W23 TaxID=3023715 RepID=UPI0037564EEF